MRSTVSLIVFRLSSVLFAAIVVTGIGYSLRQWHHLPSIELNYTTDAYASLGDGNDEEAIERLKMAARLDWHPQRPAHLFELAKCAQRVNDQETLRWAIEKLRGHIRDGRAASRTHYYFAVAVLLPSSPSQEDFADALSSCTTAASEMPNDANVHSHLGIIFGILGEHQSAAQCFQRALQLDPMNQRAQLGMQQLGLQQPGMTGRQESSE